jgi:hypothetical protein
VTEVKEFCPFDYSSRKAAEPQRIIILKIKNLGAFAFLRETKSGCSNCALQE